MTGLVIVLAAFGLFLIVSALANWDWYKGMVDFAAIESLFGEDAARWVCGVSGLVLAIFAAVMLAQRK